jgi:hypothetical protein
VSAPISKRGSDHERPAADTVGEIAEHEGADQAAQLQHRKHHAETRERHVERMGHRFRGDADGLGVETIEEDD